VPRQEPLCVAFMGEYGSRQHGSRSLALVPRGERRVLPGRFHAQFRDKNRRGIGKSQSKRGPHTRWKRLAHGEDHRRQRPAVGQADGLHTVGGRGGGGHHRAVRRAKSVEPSVEPSAQRRRVLSRGGHSRAAHPRVDAQHHEVVGGVEEDDVGGDLGGLRDRHRAVAEGDRHGVAVDDEQPPRTVDLSKTATY
jgi:hypothetical protein